MGDGQNNRSHAGERLIEQLNRRHMASAHLQPNDDYKQHENHPNQRYRGEAADIVGIDAWPLAGGRQPSHLRALPPPIRELGPFAQPAHRSDDDREEFQAQVQ